MRRALLAITLMGCGGPHAALLAEEPDDDHTIHEEPDDDGTTTGPNVTSWSGGGDESSTGYEPGSSSGGESSSGSDSDDTTDCEAGSSGCECWEGECLGALECRDGVCVEPGACLGPDGSEGCACVGIDGMCFGDLVCSGDTCRAAYEAACQPAATCDEICAAEGAVSADSCAFGSQRCHPDAACSSAWPPGASCPAEGLHIVCCCA